MKRGDKGILAIFKYLDDTTDAIKKIKDRKDCDGFEVFSPTAYHEIDHALDLPPSPVRWYTLVGGLTGMVTGFGICLLCDWDWPLIVGGKTAGIYSLPAYVVIGFELTILLGALATILGMLIHCKIPNPNVRVMDKRILDDRFAIFIPNASKEGEPSKLLQQCGAEELRMETV